MSTDEAQTGARVRAAAEALLQSLNAVEWAGTMPTDDGRDEFDACPNCGAPAADDEAPEIFDGRHYAHCELRDALDAALGVTSPRVVHPAHAKAAADA